LAFVGSLLAVVAETGLLELKLTLAQEEMLGWMLVELVAVPPVSSSPPPPPPLLLLLMLLMLPLLACALPPPHLRVQSL